MQYCENCGAKIQDGSLFCEECGEQINSHSQAPKSDFNRQADAAKPISRNKQSNGNLAGLLILFIVIAAMAGAAFYIHSKKQRSGQETADPYTAENNDKNHVDEIDDGDYITETEEAVSSDTEENTEEAAEADSSDDTADRTLSAYYEAEIFPLMSSGYDREDYPCPVMLGEYSYDTGSVFCTYEKMLESCKGHEKDFYVPPYLDDGKIVTAAKWDAPVDQWYDGLLSYDGFIDEINRMVHKIAGDGPSENSTDISDRSLTDEILPESDNRYLTESDLAGLSAQQLTYARNEIYARHGRSFKSEELNLYFSNLDWYEMNTDFKDDDLSEIEKRNAEFISDYQNSTGKTYNPR